MSKHEIVLTKGDVPHLATEPITGNVVITMPASKSVERVEIKLRGDVETGWWENQNYHDYHDTLIK